MSEYHRPTTLPDDVGAQNLFWGDKKAHTEDCENASTKHENAALLYLARE